MNQTTITITAVAALILLSPVLQAQAQDKPLSLADTQGRLEALVAQRDRAANETVILQGALADLRQQLEAAKKQCPAPATDAAQRKP